MPALTSQKTIIAQAKRLPVGIKLLVGLVILATAFFGYRHFFVRAQNQPSYQTAAAEKGTLVVSITGSGQVSSANTGTINTSATGVVKKVSVQNGQTVKMGAVIAELELDQNGKQKYAQASASYQSAKNSLTSAQTNLYTLQASMFGKWDTFKVLSESDLYKENSSNRTLPEFIISQNEWLATEAQYKNQQAVIAQAQTSLNSAAMSLKDASPMITAPISGKVTGLSLQPGTVLTQSSSSTTTTSTSQKVASIQTDANPTISVSLSEVDAPKINVGDKATVTLDALADKTFTGQVISVDTVGSVSSGVTTYPTVIKLDTQSPQIFNNMSAQVSIITDVADNVLLVPAAAVQTVNGSSTVRVLKNGQPETVPVSTGLASAAQVAITAGLNENDQVITSVISTTPARTTSTTTSPFSTLGGNRGFGGAAGGGAVRVIQR